MRMAGSLACAVPTDKGAPPNYICAPKVVYAASYSLRQISARVWCCSLRRKQRRGFAAIWLPRRHNKRTHTCAPYPRVRGRHAIEICSAFYDVETRDATPTVAIVAQKIGRRKILLRRAFSFIFGMSSFGIGRHWHPSGFHSGLCP